ncbi:MAG: divalent metal cation transporter [Planctomycetaceae bacterium]|jgi:manganese transport protein|nr:divalent metal cation transporter [Planctomycetaceae bacterium]MBT6155904.1 divalent metal cation transporter [Planctomycetaceae bacterium]MBT6483181.1 divalent metal cation transporter [Planctomycetaceae bacterium]MBT6495185.1 divalent metal cation transporter [Planctomycetaceae bacterium]
MSTAEPTTKKWYQRLGPGLITACVVIGPGSILTSSKVGSTEGYGMSWVVVTAVCFMLIYMGLGAKLGVVSNDTPCNLIANRAGRWLAVIIGIAVFFISASFQFGNNLGVASAFQLYLPKDGVKLGETVVSAKWAVMGLVVAFNTLSISFLFLFKNLYKAIERLMMMFVAVMLVAFAANLIFAKPDLGGLALGFLPGTRGEADLSVLGLVGTTFVITAGFFQAYLVQEKGWKKSELRDGQVDACVGSTIMALITLMLMTTAAAVLRGQDLGDVKDVAKGLEPLFGQKGQLLFCLGLFSAAYSSFLVNSMIGGFILSDGLGLGGKPTDFWPRVMTTIVLLTGMGVALFVVSTGIKPVPAIVAAQAVTVLAAPLIAGALLWLTNRKDIMGEDRTEPVINVFAGLGFVILVAMSWYTASEKVWPKIEEWRNPPAVTQSDNSPGQFERPEFTAFK